MLLTIATCGLRFGEAWGLRVGDVDLAGGKLYIRRAIRKHVVTSPKTGQARTVTLPAVTLGVLRGWLAQVRAEAALRGPGPLSLFAGDNGKGYPRLLGMGAAGPTVRRRVRRARRRA